MLPENDEVMFPIPLFHKAKLYTSYTDGPFGKRILHLAGRESYKMASFYDLGVSITHSGTGGV